MFARFSLKTFTSAKDKVTQSVASKLKTIPPLNEFMKQQKLAQPLLEEGALISGLTYHIETYGCQMNESDTEIVHSILQSGGMTPSALDTANLVLLNTCAIREGAEKKIWNRLQQLRFNKKEQKLLIGVLGCMAERLKEQLIEKSKVVDLVVGPDAYRDLPRLVNSLLVRPR